MGCQKIVIKCKCSWENKEYKKRQIQEKNDNICWCIHLFINTDPKSIASNLEKFFIISFSGRLLEISGNPCVLLDFWTKLWFKEQKKDFS
jgi:hypothetical protein